MRLPWQLVRSGRPEWMPRPMWERLRRVSRLVLLLWCIWPLAIVLWMYFFWSFAVIVFVWVLIMLLAPAYRILLRREVRQYEKGVRADDYARCLECGYLLRGLPPSYHCPECGTAYELKAVRRAWAEAFDDELTDELEEGNWECFRCGQKVPGHFEICWGCETPRPKAPMPETPPEET